MAVDIGLWRSTLGDTHPHVGLDIEWDYWPQTTHLVWEAPALVACFTGGGGGSQQAMFKKDLDPVIAGAFERWQAAPVLGTPAGALERFFVEIQAGFDGQTEPFWANEFQATGCAALIAGDAAAVGNVGLGRVYRWRPDGRLEQLTVDDTLAGGAEQAPDFFYVTAGAAWRMHRDEFPDFNRWQVTPVPIASGDVLVVISGMVESGMTHAYLTGALETIWEEPVPLAGAQDLADRLGSIAMGFARSSPNEERTEWKVHSRLAIAIAWLD